MKSHETCLTHLHISRQKLAKIEAWQKVKDEPTSVSFLMSIEQYLVQSAQEVDTQQHNRYVTIPMSNLSRSLQMLMGKKANILRAVFSPDLTKISKEKDEDPSHK